MGIVQNQSIKNTVITFFGFGIGAINALFFYTHFLGKEHYGIVSTLLSGANIMMPLMAFGAQNTIIRFYTQYDSEAKRERFLAFMALVPFYLMIPIGVLFYCFYDSIASYWVTENPTLQPFFGLIPVIGFLMAYFEVFYAWVKVHLRSVYGNFIYEVFGRALIMFHLILLHFDYLTKAQFIYSVTGIYALQTVVMFAYAMRVRRPSFALQIPHNFKEIFYYSSFIIVSGGIAVMLVDFDKVMIPQYLPIAHNAVYSVAIFIATVIAVPYRAMNQIVSPITARLMVQEKWDELQELYQKTSINLQITGGLLLVLILTNIHMLYRIIPDNYDGGVWVVFMIGISKYYDVLLGNNNAIIVNTRYYRMVLFFGVATVVLMIVLNAICIPLYGINGSALATLLTIMLYNTVKFVFVVKKLKLFPFTQHTVRSVVVLLVVFGLFYAWEFPFHPIINIVFKSLLVAPLYLFAHYYWRVSDEVNEVMDRFLPRFLKR